MIKTIKSIYTIDSRRKFTMKFWKKVFWKKQNLINFWVFFFSLNPFTYTTLFIMLTLLTSYLIINNGDSQPIIPYIKLTGIFWVIPVSITYIVTWVYLIIKGRF